MVAWGVKDFGGRIPRQDPRLLPDNMGEVAINCDLQSGPLDGLTEPKLVIDLTGKAPWQVRKAYRFPGPAAGQPDVWLPLPSEFSSVVRSPLANDTLHRLYWTNPTGTPEPGGWWNTYDRIATGAVHYNMGFIAPNPAIILTVVPSGGTTTVPQISRSYCFTYINQYGEESSPCQPSAVVDGAPDATWTVSGLPTVAPASPAGKNFPTVVKMRLYRTIVGTSTGAQFFTVIDLNFGSATYADAIPDTSIVSNNLLESTSWAPPVDNLDGLIAMTGGMLIGFTGNTLHFCEQDRPHAWPAGYDQSLLYQIVGLAVWQQSLVVLTQGFPSMGAGSSPSNMQFQSVQAPEPCIARGSIVTDLAGVYYSSQNGLIMLSYFGMTNQTLSNMTRNIWLNEFKGADIVACRHRTQYLAINGTHSGFLIDYSEQRMGVVNLNTFLNAVAVWNDVYTGDAYICANQRVYLWDATVAEGVSTQIFVRCSFTAQDGTLLENYNYFGDIGANFIAVGGNAELLVINNTMQVINGTGIYQATGVPYVDDYTVAFKVLLSKTVIRTGDEVWVAARSLGVGTGYQAKVSSDDITGYIVSLAVLGTGMVTSITLGALSSETELDLLMSLSGSSITLAVTRPSDRFKLNSSGGWVNDPAAVAISITDHTYPYAGVILVCNSGIADLPYIVETPDASDANFPIPPGYSTNEFIVAGFDFARNWTFRVANSNTNTGIIVTDLNTMDMIKSATMTQMYAGTSFGSPPGSPPSVSGGGASGIYDVAVGSNTDLYILTAGEGGLPNEFARFTRVDPNTMKVTGEFYIDTAFPPPIHSVMGGGGQVNTTATHTIVAYQTNSGLGNLGAQVFDGTGMQPLGIFPPHVNYNTGNDATIIPGKKFSDGSCDFLFINPQHIAGGTLIDIWRVHITDSLAVSSGLAGTVNVSGIVPAGVDLWAGEANYDPVHDTIIIVVTNQYTFNSAPSWIMSVNYDGSINWWQSQATAAFSGAGHANLTGGTYMTGDSLDLTIYDTGTGKILGTAGTAVEGSDAGSFYRVYDSSRLSYWTYALSRGQTRIFFENPRLAMDDLLVEADIGTFGLVYRWRSRQFYLPAPSSLGACQISLAPEVSIPPKVGLPAPPLDNGDPLMVLPPGVNALFRLFVGPDGENLYMTKILDQPRMIFRLPSGLKAFNWQFEILGRVPLHSVELASTMRELRKV